jgi:hypothetical protein
MRNKRDGQPIPGTRRTVQAADVEAILRPTKEPKPAPLPPTPAQARRAMSDKWADDLEPPDYERSVVSDPDAIANALGLRPDDFDGAPLGSQPEGQPIVQPGIRPKIEPRPEQDTAPPAPSPPPTDAAKQQKAAADLIATWKAHAGRIAHAAIQAKGTDREAAAVAELQKTRALGEQIKRKLGGA